MRDGGQLGAALGAFGAYAISVMPTLRSQLRRWRGEAEMIADPERRRLALEALDEKGSNVEAVAVFAVTAPRRRRAQTIGAIAALQVAIDYLDSLEEAGLPGELGPDGGDPYLQRLSSAYELEVGTLPAASSVRPALTAAVQRCQEGQRRTHAAASGDVEGLERWARTLPQPAGYRWWEVAAGASSSVAAHALIAAAADPRTDAARSVAIDATYFPPVGALTVLLDDLVDRERDLAAGEHNYLAYYPGPEEASERVGLIADRAAALAGGLPRACRHRAILAGVAAFYLSAPEAAKGSALSVRNRLLGSLGPSAQLLAWFTRLHRSHST